MQGGKMWNEAILGLTVILILVQTADGRNLPKKKREKLQSPDDVYDINMGEPRDGGQASGIVQIRREKVKDIIRKKNMKKMEGQTEKEVDIQLQQAAYQEFLGECRESDGESFPEISEEVKSFMDDNKIKESKLLERCRSLAGRERRRIQKRSYLDADAGLWDKCIIPYIFDPGLPQNQQNAVNEAHAYYEKYTGFRFKVYDGNNSQWGLSHGNYLKYKDGSGCYAYVGNLGGEGQTVSPCASRTSAVHEIGHSLGMHHEQFTPASFDMMSTNFDFIDDAVQYRRHNLMDVYRQNLFYDMSSTMGYESWMFRKNYGPTMTANDPDFDYLIGMKNEYYMFDELQRYHKCFDEYPSCATLPVCENDGYPSVVEGVCSCRCPEGLDPTNQCKTKYVPVGLPSWPSGTFSLLKVTDNDCPSGLSPGQMTRWNYYWTWKGGENHSPGLQSDGKEYGHDVCTQTESSGTGAWPPGRYCILRRGGACPAGFEEGKMDAYGKPPQRENYISGALPDGEKGQFFEYMFCCRKDADEDMKIALPNKKAFILFPMKNQGCQQVEGMQTIYEYYVTKSDGSQIPLYLNGTLPFHYGWSTATYKTYYCAYFPMSTDCGEVKTFTTETEYTFTSPGYPNAYPTSTECMWHFKSPEGSKMKIEFTDFEISHSTDTECEAFVELKTFMPAVPGFRFCGHTYLKTHETVNNYLTVKLFSTSATPWKGFSAKITILRDSDKCYTGDGKDQSYAGTVNYAKSFNPCIPWKDVTHCKINQFDPKTQEIDLSHNYCRNVATGRMPWCYTQAERCVRENCDACRRDSCYDLYKDCAGLVAADPDFCSKNEHGEAARRCMRTCKVCDAHVQYPAVENVTCKRPDKVTGISPSPLKSSSKVGETVTYTCPTSNVVRTRTCTSAGTWTHLGYVCSGCPTGWSAINGQCYKWLGWKTKQTYSEAKASCAALNSHMAILNSQQSVDGVMALTNYDSRDNPSIWLGLTADSNRDWFWDDGSPLGFSGWEDGQPNDYNRNQDCALGSTVGTWEDRECTSKTLKKNVVCTYIPTGSFVCEDDLPNCEDIVKQTPDLCEAKTDYAWVNCRKTCKVSGCSSTVTCSDTAAANADRTHGASTVNQGQYIEYACKSGYLQTGGNSKRICLPSGQLSGETLVCTAQSSVTRYELFADREIFRRDDTADATRAVVADGPSVSTKIQVSGKITAWTFYSNFANSITFQVWRPVGDTSKQETKTFTLIGQNTVDPSPEDSRTTVPIAEADQIKADAGDVIGFYMKEYVLSYHRCSENIMPENSYWYSTADKFDFAANLTSGKTYNFNLDSHSCRIYSVRATINPSA